MNDKKTESTKSYDTIKLGIDAHSKWYYEARQLDGATPQPVTRIVKARYTQEGKRLKISKALEVELDEPMANLM